MGLGFFFDVWSWIFDQYRTDTNLECPIEPSLLDTLPAVAAWGWQVIYYHVTFCFVYIYHCITYTLYEQDKWRNERQSLNKVKTQPCVSPKTSYQSLCPRTVDFTHAFYGLLHRSLSGFTHFDCDYLNRTSSLKSEPVLCLHSTCSKPFQSSHLSRAWKSHLTACIPIWVRSGTSHQSRDHLFTWRQATELWVRVTQHHSQGNWPAVKKAEEQPVWSGISLNNRTEVKFWGKNLV